MGKPLKVFITYSHKNTAEKDELITRLTLLKREGIIDIWHDNEILPGDVWRDTIFSNLADSDLLLYLTSVHSLDSENCNEELAAALNAKIRVIPIILENCDWLNHQLNDFQALPDRGLPIDEWKPESKGWQSVVKGIRKIINKLQAQAKPSSEHTQNRRLAEWVFQQGNFLMMIGQNGRAIEAYSYAVNLNPQNANVYNNRGVAYGNKNDFDNAMQDHNTAIELNPCESDFYTARGAAYVDQEDFDNAIQDYDMAIQLDSHSTEAYYNRGIAYAAKDAVDKAIIDYDTAIKLNPQHAEAYNNRGIAYGRKNKLNNAIQDFDMAIRINPRHTEAYYNRGIAYADKNDFDNAIKDYTIAIKLRPDSDEPYYNRGNAYFNKGEFNDAITDYTAALRINPHHASTYYNRGNAYFNKGDFDNAIKDYNITIQLRSDYPKVNYNKRIVYTNKGNYGLAIQEAIKMIELNFEFSQAYHNRAVAYSKKGEVELAIKDYTKVIELYPDDPNTYYDRGNIYYEKGDYDRAIKDYTKAIELYPDLASAYINRGNAYGNIGDYDLAIEDHTKAIELNPNSANAYNNRGVAYGEKDEADCAIENYTKAIELNPNHDIAYYNRGIVWLHEKEWDKAKADLTTAKRLGTDIIANFHNSYKNVETYQKNHLVKLPEDLALLLTQRLRDRYPKLQKVLDADGNPLESPNVVNLREQLRNAGPPLSDYINAKSAFGINTTPTDVFVVDKARRNELIAAHPASADILKPFLHGQDIRRWHVDTPQQWLIFTHRGIAIDDYPAILKYLESHKESLQKRKGKQAWYELPASLDRTERFAQPKLVCPNIYNYQTFAVDTEGFYYGNTSYLIPTEEKWLCGLLNSRTVEWFYSQVSNQLTIDPLRARSGYIQQIPIPDITSVHKALIAKIVDYLIYLQQQPEINSRDLKYARDRIMLGYFERVIDGLVYEAYLPKELHKSNKVFLQPLLDEGLPLIEEIQGDKMSAFRDIFELLYDRMHLVRRHLYYLDVIKPIRIIQGKL